MDKQYKIKSYIYQSFIKVNDVYYCKTSSPTPVQNITYYYLENGEILPLIDLTAFQEDIIYYEKVTDINININENNIKKIINLQIQAYPGTCFSINESEIPLIITDKRNDIGYFYWQSTQPNINYISSLKIIDLPQEALNNTYPIIINYEYWE